MPSGVTRCFNCSATFARSCGRRQFSKASANCVLSSDAHEELRLRQQPVRLHVALFRRGGQCREVDVRRDVLLARRLIRIGSCGVPAVGHQRVDVPSGELLFARVAVVDSDEKSAFDGSGGARHDCLRKKRDFGAGAAFGMNAVAIEEFEFFPRGRRPFFEEPSVAGSNAKRAFL